VLSWLLAIEQIPALVVDILTDMGLGPVGFMLLISLILLFIGTWLDISAATILVAPSFADMASDLGIPELQFGIVLIIVLLMGLITPPVGVCLFVASGVAKRPVWGIAKQIVPFFLIEVLVVILLIMLPELTLFLPRYFGLM